MNNLEARIMDALKQAMKNKDKIALDSLRAIKSQILLKKTEVANTTSISAEEEIAILQRMVKQRQEAFEQFIANDRAELADIEKKQMAVIQEFLPAQLSPEELEAELQNIITQTGASSVKDLGKVMGMASKTLAGRANGKAISETVKKLLSL